MITVLDGAHVVTMDADRSEFAGGHVVITDNRITAVGAGRAPGNLPGATYVDATDCLITPGLVNTHHHLYQWITRGQAVDDTLFGWLTTLYPVWGRIDAELVHTAATGGLAWLAGTGCTTTTDHHYVFPRDGGDVLHAEIDAAHGWGCGSIPPAGRWTWAEQGWPAAGQRGGGHRRDPGGDRRRRSTPITTLVRLDAADRGRAVLAVLGDR